MSQIQLINSSTPINQPNVEQNPILNSKDISTNHKATRPSNLSVSKIFSNNQKWRQCKIIGKNISIRSYSAACSFKGKFFVYGGYQILNGSLKDFYEISLDDNLEKFHWKQIQLNNNTITPGTRSKHSLIGGKQRIYLIGGIYQDVHSSNDIYQWNPQTLNWTQLKPDGIELLPKLDSFGCVFLQKQGQQTIYIIGGYCSVNALMSNAIYEFVPSLNKITVVFENNSLRDENVMPPRCGHATTTDFHNIYIFGGKNEDQRFNDLWIFNLKSLKYQQLPAQGNVPAVRNGHTINYFNDKLYVFGGIHDITWELDDLHIYNMTKKSWTTLEYDSPRKIQRKVSPQKIEEQSEKKNNKKKNWYESVGAGLGQNKASSQSPVMNSTQVQKRFQISYKDEDRNQSPGKMIDEQRKKVFYQKKAEMLRNFEVNEKQKNKYILLENSSQAMKNSLDVIGNPDGKIINPDKLTQFGKESVSKFLAPLENNSNLVIGKKPCARDGHCAVMLNDELVIFGGDRHQMSFNDIYKLNFNLAQKQIEK